MTKARFDQDLRCRRHLPTLKKLKISSRWGVQNPKLQVLKTPFWPSTQNLNLNEDYFVAKIERKAKTLDEAGIYSAQPYQKNDWIVYVRCYIFSQRKQIMVVTDSIQEELRN